MPAGATDVPFLVCWEGVVNSSLCLSQSPHDAGAAAVSSIQQTKAAKAADPQRRTTHDTPATSRLAAGTPQNRPARQFNFSVAMMTWSVNDFGVLCVSAMVQ
jgi:hypothetical protein